jgi:hypothetical protein
LYFSASHNPSKFFAIALQATGENNSDEPPEVPNEWTQDGDEGGISIIEVVVEQGEG